MISLATEQIFGAYQPIKESKNAVTSFLSVKCTQSPADYSINLLICKIKFGVVIEFLIPCLQIKINLIGI